jgi:predicted peptidase
MSSDFRSLQDFGSLSTANYSETLIAPWSTYLNYADAALMKSIKDLPVWAIQGAEDTVFPVSKAQQLVAALKKVGGNVRFTVLEGHDHYVWTDTYSDPQFYDWLLQHQKP